MSSEIGALGRTAEVVKQTEKQDNTKFDILKSIITDFNIDEPCFDYKAIRKYITLINNTFNQNEIAQIIFNAENNLNIHEMNKSLHKLAIIIGIDINVIYMEDFELMDNVFINAAFFNRIVFLVLLNIYRDINKRFLKKVENNKKLNNFKIRFPHFAKYAEDKIVPDSIIHDKYSPNLIYLENCLTQLFKFWFGVIYSNAEFDKLILHK